VAKKGTQGQDAEKRERMISNGICSHYGKPMTGDLKLKDNVCPLTVETL
jgi:hypothetical protein